MQPRPFSDEHTPNRSGSGAIARRTIGGALPYAARVPRSVCLFRKPAATATIRRTLNQVYIRSPPTSTQRPWCEADPARRPRPLGAFACLLNRTVFAQVSPAARPPR